MSPNTTGVDAGTDSRTYSTGRDVDEREGYSGSEGYPLNER